MKKLQDITLSVIIPCYNERENIIKILDKIDECPISNKEIIVIDDCSTDGTKDVLETKVKNRVSQLIYHEQNGGKGAALRIKDMGTLMDPKLIDYLMKIAKECNIPVYKYVAQGGGTDAAELQYGNGGVATITISLPQRYLHSPLGVCHLKDLKLNELKMGLKKLEHHT